MKKTICIALAGLALLASPGKSMADVSVTVIAQTHHLSVAEAAAAVVIADALGLDATFVISTGRRCNAPLVVLGPAYVISYYTRVPVVTVWGHHKRGEGWGQIAHRLGMHPGTFNKLRVKGDDWDEMCWVNLAHRSYGYGPRDFVVLEGRGMPRRDVIAAFALSEGRRDRLTLVAQKWDKGKGWKLGDDHGRKGEDDHGRGKSDDHGPGKGQGKGKGKGHGGGF